MSIKQRAFLAVSSLAILLGILGSGSGAESPHLKPACGPIGIRKVGAARAAFLHAIPDGDLLVSRSVYTGTAATVSIGQTLPGGGKAIADGTYPGVWGNNTVDGSFGVTSPIFIDRSAIVGDSLVPIRTLPIPTAQMVTSFSSKSELALHVSTDGQAVTFMGYVAPPNMLDISNSNTPNHVDPTNPVALAFPRAVGQIHARGASASVVVTPVNTYSGNNGRSAILDSANHQYLLTGNAGNGKGTEPIFIVNNTGVQLVTPGGGPETTVVGVPQGVPGAAKGFQFGFAVGLLGYPDDKSGKDDNYRGLTIFDNTLYVTKGSGGNGIDTVYQVGAAGTLPTAATASTTPIRILPGFPSDLASGNPTHFPFGIWFADATTLYVADEGTGAVGQNPNAGLEKWILVNNVWQNAYTLQDGLHLGVSYGVPGLPTTLNPAPNGLRSLTGRHNGDGTVTLWAVTSTTSASGDQGADPNQLLTITDTLAFTTGAQASGEAFTLLQTASFGQVLRGVAFVPISDRAYARQIVQAILDELLNLPDSDFTSPMHHGDLEKLLGKALDALEDRRFQEAEAKVEGALDGTEGITLPAVQDQIRADLEAALDAIPEHQERRGRR
jgi:hypothetical protein